MDQYYRHENLLFVLINLDVLNAAKLGFEIGHVARAHVHVEAKFWLGSVLKLMMEMELN